MSDFDINDSDSMNENLMLPTVYKFSQKLSHDTGK